MDMKGFNAQGCLVGSLLAGALMLASCGGGSKPKAVPGAFQKGATLIVSVTGKAELFPPGQSTSMLISSADVENPGDTRAHGPGTRIKTGPDSEVILLLSNGTSATLGSGSDLLVDTFEQQEFEGSDSAIEPLKDELSSSRIKLGLGVGELTLKVKKLKKSSFMEVGTPMGNAGVRGTQFKVEVDPDKVGVSVLSGSVEFVNTKKVAISIGKQTRLLAIRDSPPEQGALPAETRSRIESANQAASKRMALFKLQDLARAFEEVNQVQAGHDPEDRLNRFLAAGGRESTEVAIRRGLDWLKAGQASDGSWGRDDSPTPSNPNAMTGMALLCYLGHGDLPDSPEYGETIHKAIQFLTSNPPRKSNIVRGSQGSYSHAIRTEALCTAYAMTKLKKLEPWARTAAQTVVDGQNESGGWAYGYGKGPAAHVDLSVTGWNVDALKAAALTDLQVEGLDISMDKAIAYVKRCQDKTGKFAYKEGGGGKASLTGMGVMCLQVWKNAQSVEARKGLDWIVANQASEWSQVNPYEWHRSAKACFLASGVSGGRKYWDSWNKEFQDIVCKAQEPDGHWPEAAHFHGDSAVFRTTMAIRMLEVFYQYAFMESR